MKTQDYPEGPAPHILTEDNILKREIVWLAALLPALLGFVVFHFPAALVTIAASLMGILAANLAAAAFLQTKFRWDGFDYLAGLVLVLWVPPYFPAAGVAVASLLGLFFGKLIFGSGPMANGLLNPALLGYAFLQLNFPHDLKLGTFALQPLGSSIEAAFMPFSILLGGILLLSQRLILWEVPLIFAGVLLGFKILLPFDANVSYSRILFTAFFLISDPLARPLTRRSFHIVTICAAVLTYGLYFSNPVLVPEIFALLLMNLFTPWLDQWSQKK